jgi:hypothetical protein
MGFFSRYKAHGMKYINFVLPTKKTPKKIQTKENKIKTKKRRSKIISSVS